jgi:hydroxymethylbilane synthase
MLPSVGQGTLGIELRKDDGNVRQAISFLNHGDTGIEVTAERAFLKRLGGGCQLPIAAYGKKDGDHLVLKGLLGSLDGGTTIREEMEGRCEEAETMGAALADAILSRGGRAILRMVYESCPDNR